MLSTQQVVRCIAACDRCLTGTGSIQYSRLPGTGAEEDTVSKHGHRFRVTLILTLTLQVLTSGRGFHNSASYCCHVGLLHLGKILWPQSSHDSQFT